MNAGKRNHMETKRSVPGTEIVQTMPENQDSLTRRQIGIKLTRGTLLSVVRFWCCPIPELKLQQGLDRILDRVT